MKRLPIVLSLAGLALPAALAQAQAPDPLHVRSWAAACAACHGTHGNPQVGDALAGRPREEIAQKLLDFKNGRRPATVMHQLAKGYSDEQIAAIAGWFAAQKRGAP
jgi:cytochrome subunit of sulfide dehydrogenase